MTSIGLIAFSVLQPTTIEEFNLLDAGATHDKDGNIDANTAKGAIDPLAVLGYANDNVKAHITLGQIRGQAVKELIKLGATVKTIGQDANGKDVGEKTDIKWIARGLKELGFSDSNASAFFQEIADKIGFSTAGTREVKDFTSVDLKDAKAILEAIGLGNSSFERVKANLEGRNPGLVVETDDNGAFSAEGLAKALKVERARAEKERQGALL